MQRLAGGRSVVVVAVLPAVVTGTFWVAVRPAKEDVRCGRVGGLQFVPFR